MNSHRLYKKEKLCSNAAIDLLFSPVASKTGENNSIMAYPWRAVWRINDKRSGECTQFLITVPKKRLRRAVDRVKMRRRLREAYRLTKDILPSDAAVDIAFIYVADNVTPYSPTRRAVKKILSRIVEHTTTSANE